MVLLGPFLEEVLFRGAIFGPMRRRYNAVPMVLATAVFFTVFNVTVRRSRRVRAARTDEKQDE